MTEVHDFDDRILEEKQDEIFLQQAMEELMLESDDESSADEDFLDSGVSGEIMPVPIEIGSQPRKKSKQGQISDFFPTENSRIRKKMFILCKLNCNL